MESKQFVLDRFAALKSVCDQYKNVTCLAVSKRQDNEKVKWLYEVGHRDFAESYFQEWEEKKQVLPDDIRWHFVGQIQSRKVKPLCEQGIQSIHSLGSASSLNKWMSVSDKPEGPNFLQLNLEGEEQKGGLSLEELDQFKQLGVMENIDGFMTIPPKSLSGNSLSDHFKRMRQLCDSHDLKYLSMGMSSDWKLALDEGATHIRVGTGIFGERA